MSTRRQALSRLSAAAAVTAFPGLVAAQSDWPNKPIRLIASSSPGSSTDVVSRLIADGLSQRLGQPVVVETKPGAAGMVAAAEVARAPADGYTFVTIFGSYAANVTLNPQRTYKDSDLTGVSMVGLYPGLVVAHPSLPKTLAGIVQFAKANPNALSYSSGGAGTLAHIKMAQWAHLAGIQMTHVPYKGGAGQAIPAMVGGEVQLAFFNMASLLPHIRSGRLKALAAVPAKRLPELPNVPTLAEQGFPGIGTNAWQGMFAPAGTPKPVVDKLHQSVVAILTRSDQREGLAKQMMSVEVSKSPEEFTELVRRETQAWADFLRANPDIKAVD